MGISLDVLTKTISVTSPTTSVTIQELVDAVRDWEDELCNMTYNKVIDAVGKADLGGNVTTGIVVSLNSEWQIQFWGGSGLTKISGGTIVGGVGGESVKATGTAGDLTIVQTPVNTTIVSTSGSGATAQEVWEYNNGRTLSNPDDYKADIGGLEIEGSMDLAQMQRVFLAALAGLVSGAGTTTTRFRDLADTKDRIVATVDGDGNRLTITLDGSP